MNFPLGYITPAQRTRDQEIAHDDAMAKMPARFQLTKTAAPDPGPYVDLKAFWKDKATVAALGFEFTGTHQLTGSCVGAGGGNVCFSLAAIEVLRLHDPEQIVLPFWPYTYGISRMLLGETSEGEGSLGSTFAEAARTYGVLDNAVSELPKPQNSDGLIWGESVEMKWSNGKAIASNWLTLGKKHLIKTTAPIRSSQEAWDALSNFYPVTFANNNFVNPGSEQIKGDAVVGTLNANGGHQTSLQRRWDHPNLGRLFWYQNQWGRKVYKTDPKTGDADGVWITSAELDRAIRSLDAEVFAFSQFDGFPAQYIMTDWGDIFPKAAT